MAWQVAENRLDVRFPYTHPVSFIATGGPRHSPTDLVLDGKIVDLSNGGMGIRTQERGLEEGTVVRARVPVSDAPIAVPVLSQVKWVREEGDGVYLAGLRFVFGRRQHEC